MALHLSLLLVRGHLFFQLGELPLQLFERRFPFSRRSLPGFTLLLVPGRCRLQLCRPIPQLFERRFPFSRRSLPGFTLLLVPGRCRLQLCRPIPQLFERRFPFSRRSLPGFTLLLVPGHGTSYFLAILWLSHLPSEPQAAALLTTARDLPSHVPLRLIHSA